jgi:hypothetical protein
MLKNLKKIKKESNSQKYKKAIRDCQSEKIQKSRENTEIKRHFIEFLYFMEKIKNKNKKEQLKSKTT